MTDALAILRTWRAAYADAHEELAVEELDIVISALEARDAEIAACKRDFADAFLAIKQGNAQIKAMAEAIQYVGVWLDQGGSKAHAVARLQAALTPDIAALVERAKLEADVITKATEWVKGSRDFDNTQALINSVLNTTNPLAAHAKKAGGGNG